MRQKRLDGNSDVVNKTERIREIARELGSFTTRQLVERARKDGVYSDEDYSRAAMRGLESHARHCIKEDDEAGLQEFGPTSESAADAPLWKQRTLWTVDDYRFNLGMLRDKEDALHENRQLLLKEAKIKYPRAKFA